MARGAAAGEYTVKSCGQAHAWCGKCRPSMAVAQRKPKMPRREYDRPCRKCGRCDLCLGLTAPDGMKFCRKCGATKPIEQFAERRDTGGRRNACNACRNIGINQAKCGRCQRSFTRKRPHENCPQCRTYLPVICQRCGTAFDPPRKLGLPPQYCSALCREATNREQRLAVWAVKRTQALEAYGGTNPMCVCCSESQPLMLALDHMNGGGGKQHRELGGGGFYVWLRRNNYPSGFQVLCHNCNMARQLNGGVCPHKS